MGLLAKIFGAASKEELEGLRLAYSEGFWILGETKDLAIVLKSLHHIIGENCFLFFEGGYPNNKLQKFIELNQVPAQEKIARGTIWPKQPIVHLPATQQVIENLMRFAEKSSPFEFGVHFHVYRKGEVIIEWHDAFTQEMLVSKTVPEGKLKAFAEALGVDYHYKKSANL